MQRWEEDLHRFPPYQHMDRHGVVNQEGRIRVPSVWLLGQLIGRLVGETPMSPQEVVDRCRPGSSETLQGRLVRLPTHRATLGIGSEGELVQPGKREGRGHPPFDSKHPVGQIPSLAGFGARQVVEVASRDWLEVAPWERAHQLARVKGNPQCGSLAHRARWT